MNRANCPEEMAVAKAARAGKWEASLAEHAASCAVCREVTGTSRWMKALAENRQRAFTATDAQMVWAQARLAREQEKAGRTQEFLDWAEIAIFAIASCAVAGWMAWDWAQVQSAVGSVVTEPLLQAWMAGGYGDSAGVALFSGALLLLAGVVVLCPWLVEN